MSHLSLSLLGAFQATLDGEPITAFGSDKARGLLAFLAAEADRPHRRAKLAGMFWTDFSEKRAAHNLSQTLLRLRRALREPREPALAARQPFLLLSRQDVQFNSQSDHDLDVVQFAELVRASRQHHHADAQVCAVCAQWLHKAADLYRGELLAGFFLRGSVGFEEWQLVLQENLHRQAIEVLGRLATYHEGCGEHELVQRYAGQLVSLEPSHEQGHLQLMRSLALGGQTTAAVEHYASYRRTLEEEFNLGPSTEAVALLEQIRSGQVGRGTAGGSAPSRAHSDSLSAADQGEWRQVTALVCGQAGLASSTDPEGQLDQLRRCGEYCDRVLERYGGYRQQRQGTKCLIYSGYPAAHEDAARRAVCAGLAMVRAVTGTDHDHAIGIHTGAVVSVADDLLGDVPDLARGCQELAAPGTVLITADTERLVRGWFRRRELGLRMFPGIAVPVKVYQVLGESDVQTRLDWLARTRDLTSFVGRQPELDCLQALDDEARRGSGQVILIGGQPGIGKSRLLSEFRTWWTEKHRDQAALWLESHCSAYFQNSSLYPIVGLLEQLFGFETGDSPEVKRGKLDTVLARCDLAQPAARWLLSLLLALPTDTPAPQTITAADRERMREMWVVLLQKHAARRPLVVAIEDLHWSDRTTIDWLGRSFDALGASRCLVLLTHRPSFASAWLPRENVRSLALKPLSPAQAERLVSNVAGGRALSDELCRRIVGQSDGIPLYVEELTRAIPDRQTSETSGQPQIPATLRDSLMARLDLAGAAKETAQWAAVLGREFSYPILRAIVPYDEQHLRDDLAVLIEADLLTAQEQALREGFAFKHSLIQEAAYASLLRQTRRDRHRHVAETLEEGFPQVAEAHPQVLAEHYASAGLQSRAVDCWLRAGEQATIQGATEQAKGFLERAIDWIEPGDGIRRWEALAARETVLFFRDERAAQQADIAALVDLAETLNDDGRRALAQMRRARYATTQADYAGQLEAAEMAIAAARCAGEMTVQVEALAYKVTALMRLGERIALPTVVEETLALAQTIAEADVRAYAHAAVALYYLETGDLARAAQFLRQSLEASRGARVRDLDRESQYHGHLGFVYARLGLYAQARDTLQAGLKLAILLGIGRYQAYHLLNFGFVYWRMGDLRTAIQMEAEALDEYSESGEAFGQAVSRAYLGYVYAATGNRALAAEYLAGARAGFAALGIDPDGFEVQAVAARVALAQGQHDEARQLAMEVWRYLCEQGTEGLDSPAWVHVCIADVAEAIEIPGISAREVIKVAYRELMERADKISDAAWRESFLNNVAENAEIVERWTEIHREDRP